MALAVEERTIDGLRIRTVQLPPIRATRLEAKIIRLSAPAVREFRGVNVTALETLGDLDIGAVAPVLAALFANLDDKMVTELIRDTLICTTVIDANGRGIECTSEDGIDAAFEGKNAALLKAMAFVIEVNFKDFISGVVAKAKAVLAAKAAAAATPASA